MRRAGRSAGPALPGSGSPSEGGTGDGGEGRRAGGLSGGTRGRLGEAGEARAAAAHTRPRPRPPSAGSPRYRASIGSWTNLGPLGQGQLGLWSPSLQSHGSCAAYTGEFLKVGFPGPMGSVT